MKCRRRSYYYAVDGMRLGMSNHPDFNRHLGQVTVQSPKDDNSELNEQNYTTINK